VTDEPWLGPLAAAGGRTTLIVPLPVEGSIVGALVAVDRRDVMAADPDEGGALVEFGQMSAAIVRRAALDEAANATRARARIGVVLDQPELLQPVFQPILSLATGNVVAYEALARFALEPVQPPAVWFDLAARTGLGVELQALAIRRAIETSGERRLPHRASLMLNVSPGLLDQPEITLALGDVGLERIVIEMTEDEPIADYGRVRETMARLRARRIRFGIDDAGAGYASMRHVTELRPEFVKLDAQLISGLGDDSGRQALVRALETFTREIGAKLIAEGVETLADLRLLAATGLPILAQGYAIARPGPAWPSIEPEAVAAVRDARGPSAMLRVVRRHRVLGPAS
jgi:EAL domain-containing protein (putative c-di-GMP-specific phosphodiesterase class I)